jgi:hypothetical protein
MEAISESEGRADETKGKVKGVVEDVKRTVKHAMKNWPDYESRLPGSGSGTDTAQCAYRCLAEREGRRPPTEKGGGRGDDFHAL